MFNDTKYFFQHGADVDVANDENSLGFQLDLCSRYAEALKVHKTADLQNQLHTQIYTTFLNN